MEKNSQKMIFSVSEFVAYTNQILEYAYPAVEVEGEVSSFKVNQGKYVFFDLKDEGCSIGCFMSVWQLRQPIEDGMKVVVLATPKLTQWGKFSLTVKSIRPRGEGAIKKSFELLKAKLEQEGLFAASRKRLLPTEPHHVAVISSTQAAGYADFIKIIGDRWGGMQVDVAHVQVQGAEAPDQIIRAINYFNQQDILPEVLVIIRGGGSEDDLSTFNDEMLVRAIASSRIPTLVGVGHETDETLADLAADERAATPSNAAQILVPDKHEIIRSYRTRLGGILPKVLYDIDAQQNEVKNKFSMVIGKIDRAIDGAKSSLERIHATIKQLDPNLVLERGYAIWRGEAKLGAEIEIETYKNIMKAEVKNVTNK